jgi:YD repeat-containing protein
LLSSRAAQQRFKAIASRLDASQHRTFAQGGRVMTQLSDFRSRFAGFRVPRPSALLGLLCAFIVFSSAHAASIDYEFNSKGQLVTARYSDGTVVTYDYDENGNRRSVSSTGGPDTKAPTMPSSVTATVVSSTRIDVSWSASTDGGASGLAGYKVERCLGASCTNFTQVGTPSVSPYQNSGLAANSTYRYRLRANDNAGNNSPYSAIVSATTLLDTAAPSVPGNFIATVASSTQINLSWNASTDTGGSGLAGYKVERCQGAACTNFSQVRQQSGVTWSNTGLAASTTYRYRVRGYDNGGNNSGYSTIVDAATTADTVAPGNPAGLNAVATSPTQINLTWTASTDSGGSGHAGYKIERCQGAGCTSGFTQIATATSTSYSNSGLVASTAYSYRVRAYDNAGNNSGYSNVASATTPADTVVPTTPASLTAAATSSTQIDLSWTGSTDSGGSGLTGYKVERCQGAGCTSGFTQIGTPTGTTYSDTGRSPLTAYGYRVRAYDGAGNNSGYSNTASATTPADTTAPTTPSNPIVDNSTPLQLTISWSASTDAGGAGLAGYRVEACQGASCTTFALIATVSSTSYTHTALPPSTTYRYRVRAYDNASPANQSSYSSITQGTTQADTTPPTQPTSLTASAVSGSQVNLSWTGSTDAGGAGLAGYEVERCQGAGCSGYVLVGTATSTSFSDTGRTDATTYLYRVRAYDNVVPPNRSAYSNVASAATPDVSPPLAPPTVSVVGITGNSATVNWTTPSDNVGVAGYRYQINGGAWTEVGNVNAASIVGLTCYTQYTVAVQARDAALNWSASQSNTFRTLDTCPPGAPGTPTFTNKTTNSVTVAWTAASDNVGVTNYQYRLVGGSWTLVDASVLTASLTGLTNGTTYTFEVQARDAYGSWGPAASASFTTESWPGNPTGLVALKVAECAWKASWNPTPNATSYRFRSWASSSNEWTVTGTETTYNCPFGQGDAYKPRWVKACNAWGCGFQTNF